jgi:hypothetical protein
MARRNAVAFILASGRVVGHSEKALSNQSGLVGVRVDVKS